MFIKTIINEAITRILCPGNVYVYLVEGSNKALLIDTACGAYDLKGYIDSLTDLPYEVVLTHGHVDHAGGANQFTDVYLNPLDHDLVDLHTEIEIRQGYLKQNGDIVDIKDMVIKKDPDTYLPLENHMIFDLGKVSVEALSMPGHSDGSMAFLIEPYHICLFGDACNSLTFLQFKGCISLKEYAKHLEVFKQENESKIKEVIYSHPHNYGGIEILDQMIELCNEIVEGKVVGVPFTPGVLLGKAVDPQTYRRVDGKIANMAYLEENIQ